MTLPAMTPGSAQASTLADVTPEIVQTNGSRRREIVRDFAHNRLGLVGLLIVVVTLLAAVIGPLLWHTSYSDQDATRLLSPRMSHPFGTDELGRDVFSRILHGALVSFEVSILAVLIAAAIGVPIGLVAAFYGSVLDGVLMRCIDILFAIPPLVLAILIAGLLGPSRINAMIAIGVVYAPPFARVVRGSALSIMTLPYVEAARALGVPRLTIMVRHLLRNIMGPLIVLITVYLSSAVLTEASLSFLGLGTQPPEPSWGSMLRDARAYMQIAPWLAIFPGAAIMLLVLGFNFLGDGLRDTLDPRSTHD